MADTKILCTGGSGFIGTHLVDELIAKGVDFLNVDHSGPQKTQHTKFWINCDILDYEKLKSVFLNFQPTHVIHLAARTVTQGNDLEYYKDNTIGTSNVLEAVKSISSVTRIIVTSSQHVRKPGSGYPRNDNDYNPHGLYGESKVITEQLTRNANLNCVWVIIRPTTIWGPMHPFLPNGLWFYMKKGLYFHPQNDPVIRSYGYVKNTIWQIEKLLSASDSIVNEKVFYIGDELIEQYKWINAFSNALIHRDVILVPKEIIRILATIGDGVRKFGFNFPMDSSRFFNLTTTNPVPLEPVFEAFGIPPYSLVEGINETIRWIDKEMH